MKSRFMELLCTIIATAVLLTPVSSYADGPSIEEPSLNAAAATEVPVPESVCPPFNNPDKAPAVSSKPSSVTSESSIESAVENNGIVPGELIVGVPLMPVEDFLRLVPESIEIEHVYDIVAATVAPEIPSPEQFKYSIFHVSLKDKSNENAAKALEAFKSIDIVVEAGYNGLAYPADGAGNATTETPKVTPKIGVFEQWIEGGLENGDVIPGEIIVGTRHLMQADEFLKLVPESVEIECIYDIVEYVLSAEGESADYSKFKHSIFHIRLANRTMEYSIKAIEQLSVIEEFVEVGFNGLVKPAAVPDDDMYPGQWNMRRVGVPKAWNVHTGTDAVSVAVIDTGIDFMHEDLVYNINISKGYDAISNNSGAHNLTDNVGHGTQVAGIIGAQGNNGKGIAGINWDIEIVPMKISDTSLGIFAGTATSCNIVRALTKTQSLYIPIANLSFSLENSTTIATAVSNYSGLLVLAAGNENRNIDLPRPGQYQNIYVTLHYVGDVIIVAGTNQSDALYNVSSSDGSNYGPSHVDIAAPGFNLSAPQSKDSPTHPGANKYIHALYGTSYAAPHVAGAAALLKSYKSSLYAIDLKRVIMNFSEKVPALAPYVNAGRILSVDYIFMIRVDFDNNLFLNQSDLNTYMSTYYQLRVGDAGWDNSPGPGLPPGREVDLDFNGVINMTDIVILYAYI